MEIPTINVNLSDNIIQYTTNTAASCEYDKKQRKLQKRREEKELEELRKQKERMKEAMEAYAKYRRELRQYYNELGYQKKLATSMEGMAMFVDVKKPPVVSDAYEMIMMLGM
ncbi:MAG: hypothetical protein E7268_04840 [Lachnospiraceae bacterium]|nr:hypothetical protein [Lachnospiraceae bacterium]